MPGRLILVRHGQTTWSRAGRHTGRTDLDLEEAGRRQADLLGRRLAGHEFSTVLVSPLRRAEQTCALAGFGARSVVCEDLREWDYGAYEGRTTEEIRSERPGWSIWRDGVADGETLAEVATRAARLVAAVRSPSSAGDTLAFGHAHILRVVGMCWTGLDPAQGAHFVLEAASISVLGYERDTPAVIRWNDTAGEPVS
ncbi:MAG TPA: histidine phosphatase family protein [Acidimicrobiales bacterium]|nr:histidine phosphatase family protein [Acidimicrobiales bacterium]